MNIPTIKEDNDKIYDLKIKYKNAETENEIIICDCNFIKI